MSFDLSWFTSAGGLLITGGVILLTIALIILIVTGKKSKKDKNEAVPAADNTGQVENLTTGTDANAVQQNVVQPAGGLSNDVSTMNGGMVTDPGVSAMPSAPFEAAPMPVVEPQMPVNQMEGEAFSPAPVDVSSIPVVEPQMPVNQMGGEVLSPTPVDVSSIPVVEPQMPVNQMEGEVLSPAPVDNVSISASAAIPTADTTPVIQPPQSIPTIVSEPVASDVSSQVSVVEPTVPVVSEVPNFGGSVVPSVVPTVAPEPIAPVVESPVVTPSVDVSSNSSEPVIYGGASPIVPDINFNQNTEHQIYGGADPLQNTQTIPTVNPIAVESVPQQPEVLTQPEITPVVPVEAPVNTEMVSPVVTTDSMATVPSIESAPTMTPVEPVTPIAPIGSTNQVTPVAPVAPVAPVSPFQPQ